MKHNFCELRNKCSLGKFKLKNLTKYVINSRFEIIDLLNWSNAATIVHLVDALRGNAKTWFLKLVNKLSYIFV